MDFPIEKIVTKRKTMVDYVIIIGTLIGSILLSMFTLFIPVINALFAFWVAIICICMYFIIINRSVEYEYSYKLKN